MLLHPDTSFPEKEREAMQWPVARSSPPLMPINTRPSESGAADGEECLTAVTPTAKEARIPEQLPCPLAPRKRGPLVRCQLSGVEFFSCPPDLETVFMRHPQKAK